MKVPYRADIDGLRAIAVLSVILNHVGFAAFSGGHIGVDVFFVISGFLITAIIEREIRENEFTLMKFYERRICPHPSRTYWYGLFCTSSLFSDL